MERILRGVMKYRHTVRKGMVEQFERVRDHPVPKAVFFTCMDSRMIPSRFTQTNVGDMFIVRNAGNLVPNAGLCDHHSITTEPAALELGCVINDVKHVVVCGHSDCKAIGLLHLIKNRYHVIDDEIRSSPLRAWMSRHGASSLEKFEQLEINGFQQPLIFAGELPLRTFVAYIDPDNKFSVVDKLSQVNCLQQLQNIASYNFMKPKLKEGKVHIHALWFDIYTGNIYYFSRQQKIFVEINDRNIEALLNEVNTYYS